MAQQLLIDYYECNYKALNDINFLKHVVTEIVKIIDAKIVKEEFHLFKPYGITYFAIISKSHISIHTWPEDKIVAVDIFSCENIKVEKILEFLSKEFSTNKYKYNKIARIVKNVEI
ncbi:MAG: adenosylmethionine decarboxylase [Bacteroidales bacterium]|nr:adenosylmethionine decarboxylase [Bacteroidales bacterium]